MVGLFVALGERVKARIRDLDGEAPTLSKNLGPDPLRCTRKVVGFAMKMMFFGECTIDG